MPPVLAEKIDNLLDYFNEIFDIEDSTGIHPCLKTTEFTRTINKKIPEINENDFKKFISYLENPVDILIMSIYYVEKLKIQHNEDLINCNRLGLLWILCLLSTKYMSELSTSIECATDLGGFGIQDYILFERELLKKLEYRLEVPDDDYMRLIVISINCDIR